MVVGGCFWCVEFDFEFVEGVIEVVFGFVGGIIVNFMYKQVIGGGIGYYEVVEIIYDVKIVFIDQFLYVFFRLIDLIDVGG